MNFCQLTVTDYDYLLQGDYYPTNISLDMDKFGSMFSLPTEKYWEFYWKNRITIRTKENYGFLIGNLHFYFIQFRSRNRQPKINN